MEAVGNTGGLLQWLVITANRLKSLLIMMKARLLRGKIVMSEKMN